MKCNKCNGEWTPPPGKSVTACPFCGASLQTEPVNADSGNVVAEIVRRFGDSTLLDPQKLSGLISDLIPSEPATRKRLNLAINEKVPQKLHGLKNKDEHERDRVMRIEASGLSDVYDMAVETAYEIVNYFATALGYKTIMVVPLEVQPQPKQPIQPPLTVPPGIRISYNTDMEERIREQFNEYSSIVRSRRFNPNVQIDRVVGIDSVVLIEMVCVRGGTFKMGDTDGQGEDHEKPVHSVTLSDFYIGKYPITQKQWVQVMGTNPSKFKGDDFPVESVNWNDTQEFIQKLNATTGKKYRLPTEAEWEYAARGGTSSRGYIYAGSNNIDDVAWYLLNSNDQTHSVGIKAPNELGIFDMSGNVNERVNDWLDWEYYKNSPKTNPTGGPSTNSFRVVRGGSWFSDAFACECRVSFRGYGYPDTRKGYLGFRLARSP